MAQKPTKVTRKLTPPDGATVDRLYKEGLVYRDIADRLKSNFAAVYRAHKSFQNALPTLSNQRNVASSEPDGLPVKSDTVIGEPVGEPGSLRQHELEKRISVLEAFMSTLQQQQAAHLTSRVPAIGDGSPNGSPGSPTHKRGFVMADDLFDAIHAYADAHHLQVKTVLDMALREFFATHGWPGSEDDR